MLSEAQFDAMAVWLQEVEGITPTTEEIVASVKPLDHYIESWGEPQAREQLGDGSPLLIWRGPGYGFWIAEFGDARGAAVF
ncbi:MAG: hypothetical protein ACJAU6_002012 [Alphaproteobacteria bacterium]